MIHHCTFYIRSKLNWRVPRKIESCMHKKLFGFLAGTVFAITLIASGLSSSCCGVLAGQAILEGLIGTHVNPWIRRIVIRVINVVPATVMIMLGFNPLVLLVYSQVILSFLILPDDGLQEALTDIQHRFRSVVNSTTHIHLDESRCMEIISVRGKLIAFRH